MVTVLVCLSGKFWCIDKQTLSCRTKSSASGGGFATTIAQWNNEIIELYTVRMDYVLIGTFKSRLITLLLNDKRRHTSYLYRRSTIY